MSTPEEWKRLRTGRDPKTGAKLTNFNDPFSYLTKPEKVGLVVLALIWFAGALPVLLLLTAFVFRTSP